MYNKIISNKTLFEIYLIFRMIIIIDIIVIGAIVITNVLLRIDFLQAIFSNYRNGGKLTLLEFSMFFLLLIQIDEIIKPAFVELNIIKEEIIISTYNPHLNKWESPFILFGYKNRINKLNVRRDEYIDYKLTITKFGLRKELRLQKINNNEVYETPNINISLLRKKEYTNIISTLTDLRTKIYLN